MNNTLMEISNNRVELNALKHKEEFLKEKFLLEEIDKFDEHDYYKKLIWEHITSINGGFDIDVYDLDFESKVKYLKIYIKYMYHVNVDEIELF